MAVWKKKLSNISDVKLLERLQKAREPLRKPSYKEKKRARERRIHRADLERVMKEAQAPYRDSQTKQVKLGGSQDE